MGKYKKAEPLFLRSLNSEEAKFGKNHPAVAQAHSDLALALAYQEKWRPAIARFQEARQGSANYLSEILPSLSEHEQVGLLQAQFDRPLHRALSLGWTSPEEAGASSAEWLLNGK